MANIPSNAEWLQAASDQEAIQAAHRMDVGIMCELWEGKRLVATIEPHSGAPRSSGGAPPPGLTFVDQGPLNG